MLDTHAYGDVTHPALVFLHGFLGCKEDWIPMMDLLKDEFFCVALDLDGRVDVLGSIQETLKCLDLNRPTLVGYSMGGRVALQLPGPKVVMSAHIGLEREEEKQERWEADLKWIELLEQETMEVFLERWYAQPLFASLKKREFFQQLIHRKKQLDPTQLIALLKQMSLAKQERITVLTDTLFLFGEEDLKYEQLYATLPERKRVSNAGHAIHLENPKECANIIRRLHHVHT